MKGYFLFHLSFTFDNSCVATQGSVVWCDFLTYAGSPKSWKLVKGRTIFPQDDCSPANDDLLDVYEKLKTV